MVSQDLFLRESHGGVRGLQGNGTGLGHLFSSCSMVSRQESNEWLSLKDNTVASFQRET